MNYLSAGTLFVFLALIISLMNLIAHVTMEGARQDSDNEVFFATREPAKLGNFCAVFFVIEVLALLGTIGLLAIQFFQAARFWEQSVRE